MGLLTGVALPEDVLEASLAKYAEVIVRVGVNLVPGQRLLVRAPLQGAPLVRALTASAYRAGAPLVTVLWRDPQVDLIRLESAPEASFSLFDDWRVAARLASLERGDATVSVVSDDPTLFAAADPQRIAALRRLALGEMREVSNRITGGEIPWCVVGAASDGWSRALFPELPAAEATAHLWRAIFAAVRIDEPDPVAAWRATIDTLEERARILNARRYQALHFRAPGTDLRVGLIDGHIWRGGGTTTASGQPFVPNLPTEEVFTAPHRERVDGVVSSSKPLAYNGQLIEGMTLEFAGGEVVKATARSGEGALRGILDTDEGARRLGEVALVPESSPIARSGLLFRDTLFDENAACHLALGRGYRLSLEGAESMDREQALAAGLNDSLTHIDFMIGSERIDVDGLDENDRAQPLLRAGEWAE